MKGFGVLLLVLGGIVGLLFNWIAGAVLVVIGLLLMIAGGQGKQSGAETICSKCGNPVVKTANVCPTCHAGLIPTEGPLVPAPEGPSVGEAIGGKLGRIMGGHSAPEEDGEDPGWSWGGRAGGNS